MTDTDHAAGQLSDDDRAVVHPELHDFLLAMRQQPPRDLTATPAEIRAANAAQPDMSELVVEPAEIDRVIDIEIPVEGGTIPARIYHPVAGTSRPTHVFFHGGGFIMGTIDQSDRAVRMLAARSGLSFVSVGYRLAPESRWPVAPEDCYAAVRWVAEHGAEYDLDPTAMSVGGDSAGGNLAAVVALMCVDRGGPDLLAQVLCIPVLDMTMPESPSLTRFGDGFGLDRTEIEYCGDHYIAPADRTHRYASPLLTDLTGLPPAVVVVGECDPLCDQGRAYARLLTEAGIPTREVFCQGHGHGSMFFTGILESARRHTTDIVEAMLEARRLGAGAN